MTAQSPLDRPDPLTLSEEAALVAAAVWRSTRFLRRVEAEREIRAQMAREQRQMATVASYEI